VGELDRFTIGSLSNESQLTDDASPGYVRELALIVAEIKHVALEDGLW
jgi:hypothetical protein